MTNSKRMQITEMRIAALGAVLQSGCTAEARSRALSRVRAMSLPQRRDEYWKYTEPDAFTAEVPFDGEPDGAEPLLSAQARNLVGMVGGVIEALPEEIEGLSLSTLKQVDKTDIHWLRDLYGTVEARGHNRVDRALAALNTAYASDGLVVDVSGEIETPLHLHYSTGSDTAEAIVHHVIRLKEGARLTLVEDGLAAAGTNTVMEVIVGKKAQFRHVRMQGNSGRRNLVTHIFAELEEESTYKSFTLTKDGTLTRNEAVITLKGDDGSAHIGGALLGAGKDIHQDDTVFVTHDALRGESRQVFKKVLRNGATGVFQGKILVEPGAQKTDGYQISQSLLLDEDAQFLAKPELEIYADDVACSHGSTSGALDEEALFYLRSRGIERKQAENMLTLSFLADAIAEVDDPLLEEALLNRITAWLDA